MLVTFLPDIRIFPTRFVKIVLPFSVVAIAFGAILLLSGCKKRTVATNPGSQSNNELHESTKPLQAADLVGYDGTKLRKSVDKIIQNNDKHNKELENVTKDQ
jgi:hypothetical protein